MCACVLPSACVLSFRSKGYDNCAGDWSGGAGSLPESSAKFCRASRAMPVLMSSKKQKSRKFEASESADSIAEVAKLTATDPSQRAECCAGLSRACASASGERSRQRRYGVSVRCRRPVLWQVSSCQHCHLTCALSISEASCPFALSSLSVQLQVCQWRPFEPIIIQYEFQVSTDQVSSIDTNLNTRLWG